MHALNEEIKKNLFQFVIYDIENQRLCMYFDMFHIFTCFKSVYENNALSNDLTYSKCIFACFCIHMFYDCNLNTLNIDVFYNLNHKTAWFLCWSYDIFSRQLACSSSQRWLHISSDQQQDLSVWNADYESSASYACQKSWTILSTLTEQ